MEIFLLSFLLFSDETGLNISQEKKTGKLKEHYIDRPSDQENFKRKLEGFAACVKKHKTFVKICNCLYLIATRA